MASVVLDHSFSNEIPLINEAPTPQKILNFLKSDNLSKNVSQLAQDFKVITQDQLQEVLNDYFNDIFEQGKDPFEAIEALAECIPIDDPKATLEKAVGMLNQAKYYLEHSEIKTSPSIRARLADLLDTLISFVESILSAFGIADFFKPSTTQMQGQFKFQKVMMLISFFTLLTTTLFPLLGMTIAAPIIGGTLLTIIVLSLVFPHIRPCPSHLPYAKNWSKMAEFCQLGNPSITKGRKHILDAIAKALVKNMDGQIIKHPLVHGKSRAGKTMTAQDVTKAIKRGDYPELKGKKVFYLNASKLLKQGDFFEGKDPLEQLSEAMGRHKKDIILVIDEIHTIFEGNKKGLAQKMKEMLDAKGDFALVLGITTSQDFLKHIHSDEAFVNRFDPICLEDSDEEVTQEILTQDLLANHSKALTEKGALKKIYQETNAKGWTQPYDSLLTFQMCAEMTSPTQQSPKAQEIQTLENKKELFISQNALDFEMESSPEIEQLQEKINELQKECQAEEEQLKSLFKAKDKMSQVKKKTYKTVIKIASALKERELGEWTLLTKYLHPCLEAFVRKKANDLGVKAFIDDSVIEEAVKKLEESKHKKNEALAQAREEINSAQALA